MLSPRRNSRIARVESLSLEEKPLAEMTDEELADRLRYFPFERLDELASLQTAEQKELDATELLAEFLQGGAAGNSSSRSRPAQASASRKPLRGGWLAAQIYLTVIDCV